MTTDTLSELKSKKRLTLSQILNTDLSSEFKRIIEKLGISKPWQVIFHYESGSETMPLCNCGQPLKWHDDLRAYRTYCSKRCNGIATAAARKSQNLQTIGTEWHSQTPEWKKKVEETSKLKFGASHYSKTEEFLARTRKTNLQLYGVERPSQSEDIKNKTKDYFIKKFGVDNPAKCEVIQEKIQQTSIERYGVNHPTQHPSVKKKTKETNLEKYGVDHPRKVPDIVKKSVDVFLKNYYSPDVLEKLNNPLWLSEENKSKSATEIAESLGVDKTTVCSYFHKHKLAIERHDTTSLENKLYEYYRSKGVNVELKTRKVIAPKEIDIFFPDINFGIEINGAYWHSEEFGFTSKKHLEKLLLCESKNVELWQFWDWEFEKSHDIIISKINHKLGLTKTKHYVRNLTVEEISPSVKSSFLETSHIQGDSISKINLGLYTRERELVMVATFGTSRFHSSPTWELIRMASLPFTSVVGGASKLMSFFSREYLNSGQSVVTYAHRRFSNGGVYESMGMSLSHITPPGYVYTRGGKYAGSRNQWQKHMLPKKLEIFDSNLTERENMAHNGYYRLWDCGQNVFTYHKQ